MAISRRAHEILNRGDLIEKRDRWFQRLENVFSSASDPWNDRHVYAVNGVLGVGRHDPYTEPERWAEDCLEDLADKAEAAANDVYFRPLCLEYGPYGVHYVDRLFGAEVFFKDGQWHSRYLKTPIGQLKAPDLDRHPQWIDTQRVMNVFLEADVKLPLFGLPTIASALNIGVNLYGQEILLEMIEEPENAAADLSAINDLLCELHRRFRSFIPQQQLQPVISWNRTQPPGYGQLCGCTTQLISGPCYEEFIAPLDDALLAVYPHGGMIHICGAHTQHMDAFRSMPHLKALQLNDRAAADLAAYHQQLRPDQVIYLNPCKEMSAERAIALTGGKRLVIADDLTAPVFKP